MTKCITAGRIIFALGMLGLAVLCIMSRDFVIGRPPAWPESFSVNPALAYGAAVVVMVACFAMLANKKGRTAALVIAGLITVLSLVPRHLPHFMNDWANVYKTIALIGGALIVASTYGRKASAIQQDKWLVRTGSAALSIFFVVCAYAHVKYVDFVNTIIPDFIPFHTFFTYFAAACLFAGGIGIWIPATRRLAALLSAIMLSGWLVLLHIPRFAANVHDASDRLGVFECFTLAGVFFVLTGLSEDKNNF
jgi:uncharacterized membrane protein YphA (DoxX/SURF4 family)